MQEEGRKWREDVLEDVVFRCRQETGEGCKAAGSDARTENGEAQETRNSKHGFKMMIISIVMMMTMRMRMMMMTVMNVCE